MSLANTIDVWLRKSEPLQADFATAMDTLDPAQTPVIVRNLSEWLVGAANSIPAFRTAWLAAFIANYARTTSVALATTNLLEMVGPSPASWSVALDGIEAQLVTAYAVVRTAAYVPVDMLNDMTTLDVEIDNRLIAINIISGFANAGAAPATECQAATGVSIAGLDTGTVGVGQVAAFRVAVGASALGGGYGGNAATDALADLFAFCTANI